MRALELEIQREREAEIEANRHFNLPKDPEVLRSAEAAARKYLSSSQETVEKPPSVDWLKPGQVRRPEVPCRFQRGMDDYCFTHKQVHERQAEREGKRKSKRPER